MRIVLKRKQTRLLILILIVSSILTFPTSLYAQGFLKTSGTKIVNGNGVEVLLRGIGLGGWLVPEGYMLKTSSFANSPTEIKNKIIDLVGQTNADLFYQLYRQNYVKRKDIDAIAQWGFNSIRLPMHYELLTPKGQVGTYLESGFAIIDSLLSWCEANKLYLILDLHCAPGGQNSANISDYSGSPSLWESTIYQQQTIALWTEIARRYANKTWIGGYDLLNETVWNFGSGSNNKPLWDLFKAITTGIRSVDQNHIIIIEGNNWGNDFTGIPSAWDNIIALSFHKYWNSTDQASINWILNLRSSMQVPIWCGESGENSNQWFADCISLFESNNIGWAWWPHKKIGSTSGLLSAPLTSGFNTLLSYWKNPISKPDLQFSINALNEQAVNLNFDQCTINRGVIDALLRQPYSNETIPFITNTIPGIIFATQYDIGKNGFAYNDKDYKNTSGSAGGASWNSGGLYRNDGVDIESCSDWPTNGYNVGWIENGEFLVFTVNVTKTATYDISVRVASQAAVSLAIQFRLDGSSFGNWINVPNTGGWQSWQSVSAGQVQLTAGTHLFRVGILTGGFNLNYIEFTESPNSVNESSVVPSKMILEQNYPNPFNPATEIEFQIPLSPFDPTESTGRWETRKGEIGGFVSLRVYDLLGHEVAVLVNEQKPAGRYSVTWDATEFSSGVYFYTLMAGNLIQTRRLLLLK